MKRIILILFLLLPALAYAQPSIKFENETHDFGEIEDPGEFEHTFEFTNGGTEDLLILDLKYP